MVDVRDVADLHLRAMTQPDGAGERFIASSGEPLSLHEIALILRAHLGADARGVPTRVLPNWMIRRTAHYEESLKPIVPDLGQIRRSSSEKARQILGWVPRSAHTTVHDTADSLIDLGLVGQWSPVAERTARH